MFATDLHQLLIKVISAGIIRGIIVSPAKRPAGQQNLADVHIYLTKAPYPPIPIPTLAATLEPYWHKHISMAHFPLKKDYLNDDYLNASPASYKQPLLHVVANPTNAPDIFQTPQKPAKAPKKTQTKKPIQPAPRLNLSYSQATSVTLASPTSSLPTAAVASTTTSRISKSSTPGTTAASTPSVMSSVTVPPMPLVPITVPTPSTTTLVATGPSLDFTQQMILKMMEQFTEGQKLQREQHQLQMASAQQQFEVTNSLLQAITTSLGGITVQPAVTPSPPPQAMHPASTPAVALGPDPPPPTPVRCRVSP